MTEPNAYDPSSTTGLPDEARSRLRQSRAGLFTSDLSVNEYLLVTQAGFDPVGLVVGSSIFHLGLRVSGWAANKEIDVLSQAMYQAREFAMTRMEEEADQLGADGVVGVRLDVGHHEWGREMAEFIAVGTAIKHREGKVHRTADGRPFTSDLSGQDFWSLIQTGHRPVGLVMGSCVYHVGHRNPGAAAAQAGRSVELRNYTQALYAARELAMTRMEEEADQLGADGIVGVRLTIGRYDWGADLAEFIAVGTAVKHAGGELHRAPGGRPFTSDLSGQDFSTLLRAGYRPVGLVMGNCVYHVARQGMMQSMRNVGRNIEMTNFTQALYDARELAMGRMQAEAEAVQAGGLVGVRLNQASHGWGSHVIEFMAIATGVIPTREDHIIEKPSLVLPLNG